MKTIVKYLTIGLAALALTSLVTKPSDASHKSLAGDAFRSYIQHHAQSTIAQDIPIISQIAGLTADYYLGTVAKQKFLDLVQVRDNIFYNESYLQLGEKKVYLSYGFLGHIFVSQSINEDINGLMNIFGEEKED